MYLFGFPAGLSGGSKETVYNTGEATFRSTAGPTVYGTSHQTNRSTRRNTYRYSYRTTSQSTLKALPVYSPIPLNTPRGSYNDHWVLQSSDPNGTHSHACYVWFRVGLKADPKVKYNVYGRFFSPGHFDYNYYPNGWIRGWDGSDTKLGSAFSDFSEPFTNQLNSSLYALNGYEFTFPRMGNARIQLVNGWRPTHYNFYYEMQIIKNPDSSSPYYFADYENVSSVNEMVNTSWDTVVMKIFYNTYYNTHYHSGYNTSHNTAYDTHYQTYTPTSHITYG